MEEKERFELAKLLVARSDMKLAREVANELVGVEMKELIRWQSLHDACVVAYARPFTRNQPFGPLSQEWAKVDDDDLTALHAALIKLRHKTIAHSDSALRGPWMYPPGAARPDGIAPGPGFDVSVRTEKLRPRRFEKVGELCSLIGERLNDEITQRLNSIDPASVPAEAFNLLTMELVRWNDTDLDE